MPLTWLPEETPIMPEMRNGHVHFTAADMRSAAANLPKNPKLAIMLRQAADTLDTAGERAETIFRLHARIAALESQVAAATAPAQ